VRGGFWGVIVIMRTAVRKIQVLAALPLLLALLLTGETTTISGSQDSDDTSPRVQARFELSKPDGGPFPSDVFTVPDANQNTGLRVNMPYPDCNVQVSDCHDLNVVNTLDGFGLQTRLSIPFDAPIDPTSVNDQNVFLIALQSYVPGADPGGDKVGVNQVVWDTDTNTLHVESDALLEQARRYAVIVTDGVLDSNGVKVKASKQFRHLRTDVASWYRDLLLQAIAAAERLGVQEQHIVAASVYTTQSITSVMERIRDQIKSDGPAPANFLVGPNGERAVFNLADVASILWSQHTRLSPPGFSLPQPIDLAILRYIPNAVGAIAYGVYASPEYRVPGEYIPAVGTLTETPPVQRYNELYFTLFLPSGPRPAAGWPVAIVGTGGDQHFATGAVAAMLASHGIATIGINVAGNGFGPLGTLAITLTDGSSLVIPDAGRGIDQDGDNMIGLTEGATAAAPRTWTIGVRDSNRQNAIDLLQLVRVIEVGMDVNGDGSPDLDPTRIFYFGNSAGAMYGAIFLALEPSIDAAAEAVPGALSPEHARWAPGRRANFFGPQLRDRIPSLLNAPGITTIDGVAINPPHFNENKPLRDQPPVTNTVEGAIDIQNAMELHEWGQQSGQSPLPWARYLREAPLPGLLPKSLLILFGRGDQNAINPGTSALLRAGNLADRTVHYRHDLAFAEVSTIPRNPHFFITSPTSPNALVRSIAQGVQRQIAAFFASNGTVVIHPEPARFFEVPVVGPLPEDLNYIR
jgi:Bacterial Ig-like domain